MKKERSHRDPPRAGYTGEDGPGAGPGCSVQGRNYLLQLIITAIVSLVSLDPGVNCDHGGARGAG